MPKEIRLPDNFKQLADDWFVGKVSANESAKKLNISIPSFMKYARQEYPNRKNVKSYLRWAPDDVFRTLANDWFNERITAKEAAAKIGMHEATFRKYANRIILDSFDL